MEPNLSVDSILMLLGLTFAQKSAAVQENQALKQQLAALQESYDAAIRRGEQALEPPKEVEV
jgi:type II secretory pathway pseudopilin PulG